MDKQKIEALEVKAKEADFYLVTLFQYEKEKPEHPDYFKDWLEFDGEKWVYDGYEGSCYVCFIHERDTTN